MGQDLGSTEAGGPMATALAAVRNWTNDAVSPLNPVLDETSRAEYGFAVRARLLAVYGVPAPARLDRVIAEAAVIRMPAEQCVAFIGDAFNLSPLPERRY